MATRKGRRLGAHKFLGRKISGRSGRKSGARKSSRVWWPWLALICILIIVAGGAWGWWHLRNWFPDRNTYVEQGVEIGAEDGDISWPAVKAIGADFAYIDASASAFARDPRFVKNYEGARSAGLQIGALHRYDPCQPAGTQAANFVTTVPRDAGLLPPAVELNMLADACPIRVSDARVESELMTFLNQVETHTGKPVILKVTPTFQSRYKIAHKLDRNLWLVRDRFEPVYGGRPWTMWTANSNVGSEIVQGGLRWVVVQP